MIKRIFALILLLLICAVTVYADGMVPSNGRGGMGVPPEGFVPPNDFAPPEGFTQPEEVAPANGDEPAQGDASNFTPPSQPVENNDDVIPDNTQTDATNQRPQFNDEGGFREMPQGDFGKMFGNQQAGEEATPKTFGEFIKFYSTPLISVGLLILAFVFVIFYKRKRY